MKKITMRDNGRRRVQTVNDEESLTHQSQAGEADIRHILAKYDQTGVLLNMRNVDLAFRDVTEFEDFSDLMLQTKRAEEAFMQLPSRLRRVFDHDVAKWLDAAHDPEKLEALRPQLEELGVLEAVSGPPDPSPAPEGGSPPQDPPASD